LLRHSARQQLLLRLLSVLLVLRDGLRDALREFVAVCCGVFLVLLCLWGWGLRESGG